MSPKASDLDYNDCLCKVFVNSFLFVVQGLEGEDEGAISMLSDNTAKLTSAVRY